ncbi:tyrosine-type recombinase/integrase [Sodalis sp. RH23]|uniref:tyrosine-type recombinase/integrase n=1 Tax=unclassified Sodalis (in: enterobacteria) TaxID=2636512 RepID=UPI0039B60841
MSGKRKNPADRALPSRVYRGKTKYEFHPALGGSISLCSLDAPLSEMWSHFERVNSKKRVISDFTGLSEEFFHSADFGELAIETQKDYRKYATRLLKVFGEMEPNNIKPEHIRKYMDKRGVKSPTQANREKAFLLRVYRWAYERGKVKMNPCKGGRQFKEVSRDRYISDAGYQALYSIAPDVVRAAMELAYLCCARQADILSLKRSQLLAEGIFITQGKTGKKQIKAWSDRLRRAIAIAEGLPQSPGVTSLYILHQPSGHGYSRDGFNSRWRNTKLTAAATFPDLDFDFTFHDLKAKGISDLEGTLAAKQVISGHKNASQTARYDRKTEVVPVVGGQKK